MTATDTSNAEKIGKYLAGLIKDRDDVSSIWVRQAGDMAELWMIVDALSIDEERALRRIHDELIARFSDRYCDLRIYDVKLMGTTDVRGFVPPDARQIER